jgi:hypothetical protein
MVVPAVGPGKVVVFSVLVPHGSTSGARVTVYPDFGLVRENGQPELAVDPLKAYLSHTTGIPPDCYACGKKISKEDRILWSIPQDVFVTPPISALGRCILGHTEYWNSAEVRAILQRLFSGNKLEVDNVIQQYRDFFNSSWQANLDILRSRMPQWQAYVKAAVNFGGKNVVPIKNPSTGAEQLFWPPKALPP